MKASGISSPSEAIRISLPVDPFVMVPDDLGDLSVVIDVREDPLADYRVLFHLPSLLEGEGSGLLKKTWREADLADVVNQAAQVGKLNLSL